MSSVSTALDSRVSLCGSIPKKIYVSWKNRDFLGENFNIVKFGVSNLKNLNPEYSLEIHLDQDVDDYLKSCLSVFDYALIEKRHIVEKLDLWRLLKIFYEGGVYVDIDRLCNIPLSRVVRDELKCILPMHGDADFSQDLMISCAGNIIFKLAIELNIQRRRDGCEDIFYLGPATFFHAATEIILGCRLDHAPELSKVEEIRRCLDESKYFSTYREVIPYSTLIYQGKHIPYDKDEFYHSQNVIHWYKSEVEEYKIHHYPIFDRSSEGPLLDVKLCREHWSTRLVVNEKVQVEISEFEDWGWLPSKIVLGISSVDGYPLSQVRVDSDVGEVKVLTEFWDVYEFDYLGRSILANIITNRSRSLQLQWWAC